MNTKAEKLGTGSGTIAGFILAGAAVVIAVLVVYGPRIAAFVKDLF